MTRADDGEDCDMTTKTLCVAWERLNKQASHRWAARTVEELLGAEFSMRFVPMLYSEGRR
jgi:hypothetical protein